MSVDHPVLYFYGASSNLEDLFLLTVENLNKVEEAALREPLEILDAESAEILAGIGGMLWSG